MKRQLIMVVHGVGVREAGVASGQLSAFLGSTASKAPGTDPLGEDIPWTPNATDDFQIHEGKRFSVNGLFSVFPAHLRRFRRNLDGNKEPPFDQERHIVDYYWGDISGTGTSPLRVALGLVKIVLGLSHAIRENVEEVFPQNSRFDCLMRWLARQAALLIHGPVVAFTMALVMGLGITLGWHALNQRAFAAEAPLAELGPFWTELALALSLGGLGLAMLQKGRVFLVRHLAGWLMLSGLGVALVNVLQRVDNTAVQAALTWIAVAVFPDMADKAAAMVRGFPVVAALLMLGMILAWALCFVAAWVVWFICLLRRGRVQVAVIVPEAIALMSLSWMLLMTAVWTALWMLHWLVAFHTGYDLPDGLEADMVLVCLRFVTPAGVGLIALVLVGLWANALKARSFGNPGFHPGDYLKSREALAERHRAIVARGMIWALDFYLFLTSALFLILVLPDDLAWGGEIIAWVKSANQAIMPYLLVLLGLTTALVAGFGREALAAGVAIFTDILAYLNDYSWTKREFERLKKAGRATGPHPLTWVERLLGLKRERRGIGLGYWMRGRIFARMQDLMMRMIGDLDPDEIVVVSHSQGTVIALQVIEAMGESWLRPRDSGRAQRAIRLVTMGSPYRHLYGRYFPGDFPPSDRLAVAGRGGILADWINIFRVDDFVGTHVDATSPDDLPPDRWWPREHPVPRNGHTNYWVDEEVTRILRRFLAFVPPPDPPG